MDDIIAAFYTILKSYGHNLYALALTIMTFCVEV